MRYRSHDFYFGVTRFLGWNQRVSRSGRFRRFRYPPPPNFLSSSDDKKAPRFEAEVEMIILPGWVAHVSREAGGYESGDPRGRYCLYTLSGIFINRTWREACLLVMMLQVLDSSAIPVAQYTHHGYEGYYALSVPETPHMKGIAEYHTYRSHLSHTACNDEFRRILRSHSRSVFSFL